MLHTGILYMIFGKKICIMEITATTPNICPGKVKFQAGQANTFTQCPSGK